MAPGSAADSFLPRYDFHERHEISIQAPTAKVAGCLGELNLLELPVVALLLRLRQLPSRFRGRTQAVQSLKLSDLWKREFRLLFRDEQNLVMGTVGAFWRLRPSWPARWKEMGPDGFMSFADEGFAKAVLAFEARPDGAGTRLTTETRILCPTPSTRRRFGVYWMFVRPFSGFIRKRMLRWVKVRAEKRGGV